MINLGDRVKWHNQLATVIQVKLDKYKLVLERDLSTAFAEKEEVIFYNKGDILWDSRLHANGGKV